MTTEESYEEFSYPVVFVPKKDGSKWMCVEYRILNVCTELEAFPMENVLDLLVKVGAANFISTSDMLR